MGARLHLHPVGLNEEEHKILAVAMNVMSAGGCGVSYSEELSRNTVAVIDVDSQEGRDFYEHASDSHIRVVIAGDDRSYRADGLIRKPLRVQALRNLLTDLSEKIQPQACPAGPVMLLPAEMKADSDTLPNVSLFYVLVNSAVRGELCTMVCGDNPHPLLIHGPTRRIYTNMNTRELQEAAGLREARLGVAIVDEYAFMKQAQGMTSHRIESVLWLAGEYGASGYAPVNPEAQGHFTLNDWPRFDVKHVRPEYLTMSAITTRRPVTFTSLASMTRIPLTTVFDFYHAALACGVVEHVAMNCGPVPVQSREIPSLVSRIAKKLGLNFF